MAFHAFDTDKGRELWRFPLSRRATATPMTYRTATGRQFVVMATGIGADTALVAFTLSTPPPSAADPKAGTPQAHPPRVLR
jgi:glucose dehydrogenase